MIGTPLMSSQAFPPLYTVRAAFTAHGVPSENFSQCLFNQPVENSIALLFVHRDKCSGQWKQSRFFTQQIQFFELFLVQMQNPKILLDSVCLRRVYEFVYRFEN